MRIPNLTLSQAVVSRLSTLNKKQAELNEQLGTGQRITRASEDPQAAARIMRLRSEKAASQQYVKNIDVARGIAQASYSAMDAMRMISDRANELAALSNSDNVSADERSAYAIEVNEMLKAAIQTANFKYQGNYLFNGTNTESATDPFVITGGTADNPSGVTRSVGVNGTDGLSIQIADNLSMSPYLKETENAKLQTFISNLVALRDGLNNNSSSAITTARQQLLNSEDDLIGILAGNASLQVRLESMRTQSMSRFSDLESLISKDADVDVAHTMVELTRQQTAYQAAMQAGANLLRMSLLDYLR
jgi:flagellar hook-associated protein 3 FlgL